MCQNPVTVALIARVRLISNVITDNPPKPETSRSARYVTRSHSQQSPTGLNRIEHMARYFTVRCPICGVVVRDVYRVSFK